MNVFLSMFQNKVDPSLNIFVLCSVVSGFIVGLHPWLLTGNFTKNIQTEKQRVGVNQFNLKTGQTEQDNIIMITVLIVQIAIT